MTLLSGKTRDLTALINNGDVLDISQPTFRNHRPESFQCRSQATLFYPRKSQNWQGRHIRWCGYPYVHKQNSRPSHLPSELTRFPVAAPSNSSVAKNDTGLSRYANRLNKYQAGQSPTVVHPARRRTFQPGLSWLGDDEFETTGLAFKLARHHTQRQAANKLGRNSNSKMNPNGKVNPGFHPGRNDGKTQTRVTASDNAKKNVSQPKRGPPHNPRPKQADPPVAVNLDVPQATATSHQTLKPSPKPQTPTPIDFGLTDFTSLFGASPSLPDAPSSTITKINATDAVSRRVQFALEYHGGDYSKLIPDSLATSQGDPMVYAANTIGRRRDLGPNRRNGALEIVRGMIGKSLGPQPTA